ncbi:flagellar protein D [Thermococcus indicus]|uniref:Flagellar protein D n=2 Tax=Thermococcus indicus TaxID=2586643 RepID=A0A4Y5SNL8_9EURY|nr:flagellar protein D [Thermococcus indicus]
MTRLVTEADINAKLAELKGRVPTVVINDLREKLIARKENLTYDQLDKIVQKVLDTYGSQAAKYEQLNKRVDELGKRLTDLSMQLGRLVETLESAKFDVQEKKAETVSRKVEEVHEKIEKLEGLLEEEKEEVPEELTQKLDELQEKVEEIAEKVEAQTAAEKLEEAQEKLEELQEKIEAGEAISEEELRAAEEAVAEAQAEVAAEAPVEVIEEVSEEVPEVTAEEEVEELPEEAAVEELPEEEVETIEVEEVPIEELPEEAQEELEAPEEVVEEAAPEAVKIEEIEAPEEVPAHEVEIVEEEEKESVEVEKEEGGVKMAEKFQIPEDIASLLFEEEPRKARLEKLPDDIVSTMIALKWLGFLIDRVGIQNLERVLEFYYEIGWISESVLNNLLHYAKGTRPHHRDPEWKPAEKLTVQDHLISLLFIERLRGLRINRNVLDKLEREIKMLEKTLDEFYGI